jgi:hypothetical protein
MAGSPEGQGVISRVTTALRFALYGTPPEGWFGPLAPLTPQAPVDVRGRQFDYPIAANINFRPRATEPLGFEGLKRLATNPIVAMLIQRQKDKVAALDWQIKPRKEEDPDKTEDPAIQTITEFLRFPDQEHDWGQWVSAVIDQLLVIDAVTVYGAPTRGGGVYALQLIDGATITPLLEYGGRRPLAPEPAYQQVLKGLPAVDYTADELIYFPQSYRADKIYGYSRLEQARDLVEMSISRIRGQKGFFDFGNTGDGYFTAPENWTPEMINALEAKWNSMMLGDPATRRQAPLMPMGVEWHPTKVGLIEDAFDEYLIRLLCFPFGVAPQPFMKQTGLGKGSASTEHEAAEEGGVAPLMQYVTRLMNRVLLKWFGRSDLEFSFVEDREFDPKIASEIDDTRLRNGSKTINEVRDRNGEKPLEGGDTSLIYTTQGAVLLESILNPPEPVAPIVAAPALPAPDDKADPADAPNGEAVIKLAKAADAQATTRLSLLLGAYLAGKGAKLASAIADELVKSDPSNDDQSGRIERALDNIDWDWRDLPDLVGPTLAGVAVAAGTDAVSELGLFDAETLKRVSARATAYAERRAAEMVGMKLVDGELIVNPNPEWSITEVTRKAIRNAVTTAMDEGQSNRELAATIRESAAFGRGRADLIARSETAMADIRGAAAGWIESGVVTGARFDASPDCCEECQGEDGTVVELAEPDDLELPHPGCRCSWSAVLTDDMPGAADAPTE